MIIRRAASVPERDRPWPSPFSPIQHEALALRPRLLSTVGGHLLRFVYIPDSRLSWRHVSTQSLWGSKKWGNFIIIRASIITKCEAMLDVPSLGPSTNWTMQKTESVETEKRWKYDGPIKCPKVTSERWATQGTDSLTWFASCSVLGAGCQRTWNTNRCYLWNQRHAFLQLGLVCATHSIPNPSLHSTQSNFVGVVRVAWIENNKCSKFLGFWGAWFLSFLVSKFLGFWVSMIQWSHITEVPFHVFWEILVPSC